MSLEIDALRRLLDRAKVSAATQVQTVIIRGGLPDVNPCRYSGKLVARDDETDEQFMERVVAEVAAVGGAYAVFGGFPAGDDDD